VEIWNEDEGVLDMQLEATHEEQSGQPTGTKPYFFFTVS